MRPPALAHAVENDPDSARDTKTSVSRNVGASAGAAAAFLLLRIFAVSGWDWHTASEVADTVDFGAALSIALGTLFAEPETTSLLLMVLFPLIVVDFVWPPAGRDRWSVPVLLLIAVFGSVAISLVLTMRDWWFPIGAIVIATVLVCVRLLWRPGAALDAVLKPIRSVGMITIAGILLLATTVTTPWPPHERIETTNGIVDGYVLQTPSGFLKVLIADTREVVILRSSDVISRKVRDT